MIGQEVSCYAHTVCLNSYRTSLDVLVAISPCRPFIFHGEPTNNKFLYEFFWGLFLGSEVYFLIYHM